MCLHKLWNNFKENWPLWTFISIMIGILILGITFAILSGIKHNECIKRYVNKGYDKPTFEKFLDHVVNEDYPCNCFEKDEGLQRLYKIYVGEHETVSINRSEDR